MAAFQPFRDVAPEELAAGLSAGTEWWVVDVRSKAERLRDGVIPGAMHLDSALATPAAVAAALRALPAGARHVVFHCTRSQSRGPAVAAVAAAVVAQSSSLLLDVGVLTGGFTAWRRRYFRTRPDLVADLTHPSHL